MRTLRFPVITFECPLDLDTPSPPKRRPPTRYCDWPYAGALGLIFLLIVEHASKTS
jgi:hypothetical protein